MGESRDRDWVRTLDEVEEAVRGCLSALDRYEERFHELLDEPPTPPPADPPARSMPSPDGWAERLDRAGQEAAAVEQLLAEQEAAWSDWRQALSSWRQSVEQQLGRTVAESP